MQGHNINYTIDPNIPSLLQWSHKWRCPSFEQILRGIACSSSMAKHKPTQTISVCPTKRPSLPTTKPKRLRKTQCIFDANCKHERIRKENHFSHFVGITICLHHYKQWRVLCHNPF